MKSKLISYAMDFSSYLVQKNKKEIKNVILFGSAAREEAGQGSDVDIFVDVISDNSKIKKELEVILKKFLQSTKYKNYWKPLGIKNEINLTIGELDNWEELKPSIIANGIVIYGKFKMDVKGKHQIFFIWENIKPNSMRVLFNKQLFGYSQKGRFYEGLLQKYKGERLGKGCIVVPLEHSSLFHKHFQKYKITVKIKKVVSY